MIQIIIKAVGDSVTHDIHFDDTNNGELSSVVSTLERLKSECLGRIKDEFTIEE